eukprot:IDg3142t1
MLVRIRSVVPYFRYRKMVLGSRSDFGRGHSIPPNRLRLVEFDFEVKYKKGKYNFHADFVSRMDTENHTVVEIDEELPCLNMYELDDPEIDQLDYLLLVPDPPEKEPLESISGEELLLAQKSDDFCQQKFEEINKGHTSAFAESP